MKILRVLLIMFLIAGLLGTVNIQIVSATDSEILKELQKLKARIEQLEEKLSEQEAKNQEQDKEVTAIRESSDFEELVKIKEALGNLKFGVGVTGIVQGTLNNDENYKRAFDYAQDGDVADGSYSVDIEIEAPIGEHGTAFLHLEAGEGANVSDELSGLTGVNADALDDDGDIEIAEAWYEHSLMDDKIIFTVGKLDPTVYYDSNEVANDETTQFLADIFVNNIGIDWPDDYTPGFRLTFKPHPLLDINLGAMESDGDFEDIFEDVFGIGELHFKPKIGGRQGNYRIYGWINAEDHEEFEVPGFGRWSDRWSGRNIRFLGQRLEDMWWWRYRGRTHENETGNGFGLSFDQELTDNSAAFLRFGYMSNGDIYEANYSWSLGGQLAGARWNRPDDMIGVAYGQALLSSEYERYLNAFDVNPGNEGHFEIYYRYQVNDHLAISPDYQLISNITGAEEAHNISVFGIRGQIDF
jgi:high affinity Mn2+ porin